MSQLIGAAGAMQAQIADPLSAPIEKRGLLVEIARNGLFAK